MMTMTAASIIKIEGHWVITSVIINIIIGITIITIIMSDRILVVVVVVVGVGVGVIVIEDHMTL